MHIVCCVCMRPEPNKKQPHTIAYMKDTNTLIKIVRVRPMQRNYFKRTAASVSAIPFYDALMFSLGYWTHMHILWNHLFHLSKGEAIVCRLHICSSSQFFGCYFLSTNPKWKCISLRKKILQWILLTFLILMVALSERFQ